MRNRSAWRYPARIVPIAFLGAVAVGTVLMMLPAARAEPGHAPFVTALFTATSAVCVTGLAVVDTPTYWSTFGQVLITVLSQIGGFGIMTLATLLSLLVSRRLGLRSRLMAQAESAGLFGGNLGRVLIRIALVMLVSEAAISVVLTLRFWLTYDYSFGRAVWEAVFHAVQAFNNAGFALYPDSLVRFVGDWWICVPLALGVFAGAIGFPVLFELAREWRTPGHVVDPHPADRVGHRVLLSVVGFAGLPDLRVEQPEHARPARRLHQDPGRVHPGRDDPLRRLQQHQPGRDEHRDDRGHQRPDVHRRRQRQHRRRHQGHHVPAARVRDLGRDPGRAGRDDRQPADRRVDPAAGRHGRAARRGPGRGRARWP